MASDAIFAMNIRCPECREMFHGQASDEKIARMIAQDRMRIHRYEAHQIHYGYVSS